MGVPPDPNQYFRQRMFLWAPMRMWKIPLNCPKCKLQLSHSGIYTRAREVVDIDSRYYLVSLDYPSFYAYRPDYLNGKRPVVQRNTGTFHRTPQYWLAHSWLRRFAEGYGRSNLAAHKVGQWARLRPSLEQMSLKERHLKTDRWEYATIAFEGQLAAGTGDLQSLMTMIYKTVDDLKDIHYHLKENGRINGLNINTTYANDTACAKCLQTVSDILRKKTAGRIFVVLSPYISFMNDGDTAMTDVAIKECEIVYARIIGDGKPKNLLVGHVEVDGDVQPSLGSLFPCPEESCVEVYQTCKGLEAHVADRAHGLCGLRARRPGPHPGYPGNGLNRRTNPGYPENGLNRRTLPGYPENGLNRLRTNPGYPENGLNRLRTNPGYPENGLNA
uniref:DUF6729 domain-containing protein n=1 Tax=Branchiostoma floridae TaxID=7739 RepID=C3XT08_BRAFL|eukprot:XP_002612732.1 hypothetical protein BRAFLDRAFT_97289 [Branchiostoma floridae]